MPPSRAEGKRVKRGRIYGLPHIEVVVRAVAREASRILGQRRVSRAFRITDRMRPAVRHVDGQLIDEPASHSNLEAVVRASAAICGDSDGGHIVVSAVWMAGDLVYAGRQIGRAQLR